MPNQVEILREHSGFHSAACVPTGNHLKFIHAFCAEHVKEPGVVLVKEDTASGHVFQVVLLSVLKLSATFNTSNYNLKGGASLIVPIWGEVPIVQIDGDTSNGLVVSVGVWGIASGSLEFKIFGTSLKVKPTLKTCVQDFPGDWVKLFDIGS